MRMKDCQIVIAVAELKSFTKAAEKLHLSQPAISLAVKRFEDGFGEKVFERHGNQVTLAPSGERVLWAVRKIHDIFETVLGGGHPAVHVRIGISSLLSGSSVSLVVDKLQRLGRNSVDFEFMPSDEIARRDDLDVSILADANPGFGEDTFGLGVKWIGVNNGVLIHSRKEQTLWDQAARTLRMAGIRIIRRIEVNDCVHAYQLAADNIGMSPCVMTRTTRFSGHVIEGLPLLPDLRFRIVAEEASVASVVQRFLVAPPPLAIAV
jgi:DNA-binding transcriptional LysR family regulator